MIDRSLELMRDRGQFLSLLWPFDQRFYRQYGWDQAGYDRSYTVPLRLIESDPEAEFIEPVFLDHFKVLNPIYEAQAHRYHGALIRSPERWDYLLKPYGKRQAATYVYRRDGQPEGYAVIRYEEKRDRARANEFVALTARAYRGLLTLFKRHSATVEKFTWSAPMDDILWSLVNHWDVKTRLHRSAMGRVVDVQAALQALRPDRSIEGTVCVQIDDAHAPWNEGTWRVDAEDGQVSARKSNSSPTVRTDIQSLTQAYWGTPSFIDLRRAGRFDVEDERGLEVLQSLLPSMPIWLADDF